MNGFHCLNCGEKLKQLPEAQEIKRLKNEVEKLKADLRGKDNEINDLKALVDYLRQFRPNKEETTTQGQTTRRGNGMFVWEGSQDEQKR